MASRRNLAKRQRFTLVLLAPFTLLVVGCGSDDPPAENWGCGAHQVAIWGASNEIVCVEGHLP